MAAGRPFEEIARAARVEGVDLVVMGSYGGAVGGVDKIFFGSTAEKVVSDGRLSGSNGSVAAETVQRTNQ